VAVAAAAASHIAKSQRTLQHQTAAADLQQALQQQVLLLQGS
jgi:hypothetical protein